MDLIGAVRKNKVKVVKELLGQGADPNATDDDDNITPLHFAVMYNAFDVIPLLIAAGADLNAKNFDGLTALDIAKEKGNKKIVELLREL